MEAARRACGGHGYSLLSGLPTLFTHYVQNVTWEGDNNVMLLQVSCNFCSPPSSPPPFALWGHSTAHSEFLLQLAAVRAL